MEKEDKKRFIYDLDSSSEMKDDMKKMMKSSDSEMKDEKSESSDMKSDN